MESRKGKGKMKGEGIKERMRRKSGKVEDRKR